MKGRHYARKVTPDAMARSKEYFEQAIALDPYFAEAHADLGGLVAGARDDEWGAALPVEDLESVVDLPAEQQERLGREVQKTRELEALILDTRRLPDLLDLAGQIGLHVPDDLADSGEIVMTDHPTPMAPTTDSLPRGRI